MINPFLQVSSLLRASMSAKENMGNAPSSSRIKQEPLEQTPLGLLGPLDITSQQNADEKPTRVKRELEDAVSKYLNAPASVNNQAVKREDTQISREVVKPPSQRLRPQNSLVQSSILQHARVTPPLYTEYQSVEEINYSPEAALLEGVKMIQTLKSRMKQMELGSKRREEVWSQEFQNLQDQTTPTTLIAICGATGAGKSSILNAVLDDNIVPTSGMRACTAVVTEIAYHKKSTVDADVSFLSLAEWKSELAVLLHDLIDEDGSIKRTNDLKSDAGVAWSKVHAVYPSLSQNQLVSMTADQIISSDPKVAIILGTVKKISAKDSRAFAKEIAKYIDSKDSHRGKKDKDKKKKKKEPSLMDKVRTAAGQHPRNRIETSVADEPALWPLIRQVNVRCNAKPLSTGAVLVDLPGVADANAARNNIAKDYMKKCNCIWILAPITRAVDDKTARDLLGDAFKLQLMNGNYDDHAITFIASKCDDISCSEVIQSLHLEDDPELESIQERIDEIEDEAEVWKKTESTAQKEVKAIEKELKELKAVVTEYEKHLEALENGDVFVSGKSNTNNKKRKSKAKDRGRAKKTRTSDSDEDTDDFIDDSNSDSSDSSESSISDSDIDADTRSSRGPSTNYDSSSGAEEESEDEEDNSLPITKESLKGDIKKVKEQYKELRSKLTTSRGQKKEASDKLARFKKSLAKAQREKNAFCSLKRSEFSRAVLKEDFRTGLKDLDDQAAEERDPDNFDPSVNVRDYNAIDLPVYTCTSRDYIRIKGQIKGDGQPTCFSKVEDTGIPALQQWCHTLTIASRERAAHGFLSQLKAFVTGVESYVKGISKVQPADREALRKRWETDEDAKMRLSFLDEDDNEQAEHEQGVTAELYQKLNGIVDHCVDDLDTHFKDGLEEKCRVGAQNAASAAGQTSDEFANSMHWGTYRATLRRHGSWRRDLNAELTLPFTRNIANSWGKVFETDLFGQFEKGALSSISEILDDIEASAPLGLKDHSRRQGDICLEEARITLTKIVDLVRETLSTQQKEISRCMAPHVQAQLVDGYDLAMEERGRGSVARQKAVFHQFVNEIKDEIFEDGADVIMDRLASVANAVGNELNGALYHLAEKIEVNISVLWEGVRNEPGQVEARKRVVDTIASLLRQVNLWMEATASSKMKQDNTDDVEMD